jgi:hypothetical protein
MSERTASPPGEGSTAYGKSLAIAGVVAAKSFTSSSALLLLSLLISLVVSLSFSVTVASRGVAVRLLRLVR